MNCKCIQNYFLPKIINIDDKFIIRNILDEYKPVDFFPRHPSAQLTEHTFKMFISSYQKECFKN